VKKQKRTGGGNRRSDAAVTVRRSKVLARVKIGEPVTAIAKAVEAPYRTVQSDLSALRSQLQVTNRQEWEAYRLSVRADLLSLRRDAEKLKPKEAIDAALAIIDRLTRLDGLNAPDRSVSVKVDAAAGEKLVGYRRFVRETAGLDAEGLEKVYAFARTLNVPSPPTKFLPPDDCELWQEDGEPNEAS